MAIDVGTAIAYLDLDTSGFDDGLAKANSGLKTFSTAAEKIGGGITKVGDAMTDVGKTMTKAFTLPIVGGMTKVIKTGADFELAMNEVKAVTRELWDDQDVTGEQFQKLTDYALEWGGKTKFTITETANALKYMGMAGWDVDQMMAGLPGILNLAAAGNLDLARTSDIVTDAMTAFGETIDEKHVTHFVDVLASASANANTNVDLLGETFKYVAPIAGTAGYSIEDAALASGLMANAGIKASQAGTSLRKGLVSLLAPSDEATELMIQMGLATEETAQIMNDGEIQKAADKLQKKTLDLENAQEKYNQAVDRYGEGSSQAAVAMNNIEKAQIDLNAAQTEYETTLQGVTERTGIHNELMTNSDGAMKSFTEVIDTLRGAFAGLSEEQRIQAANTLFGKTAMAGMSAILNATEEDYNDLKEAIQGSTGAAQEQARILMDDLLGDWEIFVSQLSIAANLIYKDFEPALRSIVQKFTEWVEWFAKLDEEERKSIEKTVLLVAALGPMLTIVGKLTSGFGGMVSGIGKVVGIFDKFGGVADKVTGITEKFRLKTSDTASSVSILGNSMLSAAQETSGLDLSLSKTVNVAGTAQASFGTLFKSFASGAGIIAAVVAAIALLIAGFVRAYKESEAVRNAVSQLMDVAMRLGSFLVDILKAIWALLAPIIDAVIDAIAVLIESLLPPLVSILEGIMSILEPFVPILTAIFAVIGKIAGGVIEVLTPALEFLANLIGSVADGIGRFLQIVGEFLAKLFGFENDFKEAGKKTAIGFKAGVEEEEPGVLEKLKGFADDSIGTVTDTLGISSEGGLSSVFKSLGLGTTDGYATGIEEGTPGVVSAIDEMGTSMEDTFSIHQQRIDGYYEAEIASWNKYTQEEIAIWKERYEQGLITQEKYNEEIAAATEWNLKNVNRLEKEWGEQTNALKNEMNLSYEEQLQGHISRIEQRHQYYFDKIEAGTQANIDSINQRYEQGYLTREQMLDLTNQEKSLMQKQYDEQMLKMQEDVNAEQEFMEELHSKEMERLQVEPIEGIKTKTKESRDAMLEDQKKHSEDSLKTTSDMVEENNEQLLQMASDIADISETLWSPLISRTVDAVNQINDILGQLANTVSSRMGEIQGRVSAGIGAINAGMGSYGYHAAGLDYVPFNGYMAQLHEGERVLTKQENREYTGGGNNGNNGDMFIFYDTKPDPYEYARQMKRAKREMAF